MTKILQDKIALVTGGGQGLGQALCFRLAAEGCHVVVADLNGDNAEQTAEQIKQREADNQRQAVGKKVDVTNESEVEKLVDDTVAQFGKLDLVVSNAGILISGEIDTFPVDHWRKVVEVNVIGYMIVAKHAARVMKAQGHGNIIQINSKSGKKGSYKGSAYASSKFAGIGLTQSLALELAENHIRVNAICPGNLLDSPLWVDSLYSQYAEKWGITKEEVREKYINQVPMKRGCTYDDVANVLVFLASDQSSYMTGQAVNVTGGQEMR